MGWIGRSKDGMTTHEVITEELEGGTSKVVGHSGKYYAVKVPSGDVIGVVALTEHSREHGVVWIYTKMVDEYMGPYERECPKRILDMLTPLPEGDSDPEGEHNYAAQWRRDCYAYAEHKKTQPKLKPGDTVRFPTTGVTLTDGRTIREMVFKGKYRFEHRGQTIRMSKNWKRRYTWEVVT